MFRTALNRVRGLAAGVAFALGVLVFVSHSAFAAITPGVVAIQEPIVGATFAEELASKGGAYLAIALGIGIGFLLIRKLYRWISAKMG